MPMPCMQPWRVQPACAPSALLHFAHTPAVPSPSCPMLLLCPPPHAPLTLTRPQEICTGEKPRRGQLREIQVPQEAPAEGERSTAQHSTAQHSSL